jgi:hypothetical protein
MVSMRRKCHLARPAQSPNLILQGRPFGLPFLFGTSARLLWHSLSFKPRRFVPLQWVFTSRFFVTTRKSTIRHHAAFRFSDEFQHRLCGFAGELALGFGHSGTQIFAAAK